MSKTRYAIVGMGSRCWMYFNAIARTFADSAELVAICDRSQTRMDYHNRIRTHDWKLPAVPTFPEAQFEQMVASAKPNRIIVTTQDSFHDHYIARAMQLGCNVITEKPMTIDAVRCQAILDAIKTTGRELVVTFNYRYAPKRAKVKELLDSGIIGQILHVDYEWLLDTTHGADYFRRWHRNKANSGGLMVHKATHHFDLVNWWLSASPTDVFATGSLSFYGAAAGNGPAVHAERCHTCKADCPFRLDLASSPALKGLYLDAEPDNGYVRDQCVFGKGIDIEDRMNVNVRYDNGAQMSYSLIAFSPYEGSRITFTGTKGRLEFVDLEASYISGHDGKYERSSTKEGATITVFPQFKPSYTVGFEEAIGGHGGGDTRLLSDVFLGAGPDPLKRAANHIDGAKSILTGIAANKSMAAGGSVRIGDLVRL